MRSSILLPLLAVTLLLPSCATHRPINLLPPSSATFRTTSAIKFVPCSALMVVKVSSKDTLETIRAAILNNAAIRKVCGDSPG